MITSKSRRTAKNLSIDLTDDQDVQVTDKKAVQSAVTPNVGLVEISDDNLSELMMRKS